jgi:glycosyltransferase involved in cell wall biosynthesis
MAEQLCEDLGISKKVEFLGNTNQVEKKLCHSDLFLLPSSAESFGLAALEAMASKVPVISSNAGGLSEINIHGETGFLTSANDIESMSNYAISILKDSITLEEFKSRAYKKAEEFDIKKIVPVYEEIYLKAIESLK